MENFSLTETASIVRVLNDHIPDDVVANADCIYAFAEDPDHVHSTLERAVALYQRTKNATLAVAGWDHDRFGYPGASAYRAIAGKIAGGSTLRFESIPPIDHDFGNTRTETLALAKHIATKEWKTVIIVAPIVHQPRAYLSAVHAILENGTKAKLFNSVSPGVWSKKVEHNQRKTVGTVQEIVSSELERIRKYHGLGHISMGESILDYLTWRDAEA